MGPRVRAAVFTLVTRFCLPERKQSPVNATCHPSFRSVGDPTFRRTVAVPFGESDSPIFDFHPHTAPNWVNNFFAVSGEFRTQGSSSVSLGSWLRLPSCYDQQSQVCFVGIGSNLTFVYSQFDYSGRGRGGQMVFCRIVKSICSTQSI